MQHDNILSVSQVNNYITAVFKAEELLHNIAMTGEVSNFGLKGGYAYFSLKDANATIPCVCFSLGKNHVPKDGESVLVVGSVSYYAKTGKISFIVTKISALGQGALFARFDALKQKLLSEGIFDEAHKKPIPAFPMNVAVITSKAGAVIHDIATTIRKNNPKTDISLFDVRVQGDGAAGDIVNAIKQADDLGYDVIIVARGGGSFEDLLPYYEESVARAVYEAKTPIISAVGHEVDVTFCDFAADVRVPTPTAAGEIASFNLVEVMRKVRNALNYISDSVEYKVRDFSEQLRSSVDSISHSADAFFMRQRAKLLTSTRNIGDYARSRLTDLEKSLSEVVGRISVENPLNVLKKGALFAFAGDKRLKEADYNDIAVGDELTLKGKDVVLDVTVNNKR